MTIHVQPLIILVLFLLVLDLVVWFAGLFLTGVDARYKHAAGAVVAIIALVVAVGLILSAFGWGGLVVAR